MLGDIAIWRTDTAAEAQHASHSLCKKKKHFHTVRVPFSDAPYYIQPGLCFYV